MGNREGMLQGVPTGFIDVDKLFCGLRPGNLIILAARPAVGKTSFAMNLAANAAKSGAPVAFFSLEMSSNEITQRLLAAEAGLALSRMRNGQLTEGDWSQLIQASSDLSNCELYVDDSAGSFYCRAAHQGTPYDAQQEERLDHCRLSAAYAAGNPPSQQPRR